MLIIFRRALASPLYFLAFTLHLLTTFVTIVAQKIAGDDYETSRAANVFAATLILSAAAIALTIYGIRALDKPVSPIALAIQAPIPAWRDVPTGFLPEQVVWAKPLVKLTACIFAQRVIRHHLDGTKVGFDACGEGGKIETTIDDDYYEATVSGTARIEGQGQQQFKVTLNHYPPSTSEWGFIATEIRIKD